MNAVNHEEIIALLKEYPELVQRRDILRYELEHPMEVSEKDMLDAMSFFHGEGGAPVGSISNKTLYIAMNYREKAAALNSDARNDIVKRLLPLERKIAKLEFYLRMLSEREQAVIRGMYFEGKKQREIAQELELSTWTIRKYHSDALSRLAGMYAYASDTTK